MSTMPQKVNGLGAAHKIPEWLSFWNEFVPFSCFLVRICLHDTEMTFCSHTSHSRMSLFQFSFQMKLKFWEEISFFVPDSKSQIM